jgi:hypothetical protein
MRDPQHHPDPNHRPDKADSVVDAQARALQRRQLLAEQQRTFQASPSHSPLSRRRPPG